jgi:hypothetical protein
MRCRLHGGTHAARWRLADRRRRLVPYRGTPAGSPVGRVQAPGAGLGPSLTAAAINNRGDVAGFYNKTATLVDGFVKIGGGFITLQVPGATATQAFGVNDSDWVVGAYTVSGGATHGFIWKPGHGFTLRVDDPNGIGTTLLNGINDENDIVGFYTDSAGNTDGMAGFPGF